MVCVVDCGFESQSYQTKVYKIGICCFSASIKEKAKIGGFGMRIMCSNGATCLPALMFH